MINTYANVMRLAKELEQEQTSHAETRKLLLKACNERDSLLESIRYICDSARIAAAAELKTRKLLEEAHDDLDKMRGEVDAAIPAEQERHEFKNFHRALCERFEYCHDPIDWKRDQVSLIEHIASLIPAPFGFYEALDKHVRNGVIAAAVDIGRHHQELIRMSEKEAYADTTGEISPQEKASQ
jgi:hypothetical protein